MSKPRQLPACDTGRLVSKLREKVTSSGDEFDWRILGRENGVYYNAPTFATFFLGLFESVCGEKVLKRRQPRQKLQEDKEEEELDDEDKDDTAKTDNPSAVEKYVLTIRKTLKKCCEKNQN